MRIHATEVLGPKQSMTPDGFLLCKDVAIARTGDQRYIAADFPNPDDPDGDPIPPVEPGMDGLIRIARDEAAVFDERTIASFEGSSVVIGHTFVKPENYRDIAVGHVQNVRRGIGLDSDLLFGDMLIKDKDAIKLVRGEPGQPAIREVSCGYDADYEQISPGYGRQLNIVGNHVALVPRGRAGMRCSIQDEDPTPMKTVKQKLQAILAGIGTKDADIEAAVQSMDERTPEEKEKDEKEAKTADTLAKLTQTTDSLTANMAKLIDAVAALVPATPAAKTADAETEESKQARAAVGDAMAQAEILVPGFKAPTADSIKTMADFTGMQRAVLVGFAATTDGAALLKPMLKGRTVDALSEDAVSVTFDAATEVQRILNNASGFKPAPTADNQKAPVSVASINAANAAHWAKSKQ